MRVQSFKVLRLISQIVKTRTKVAKLVRFASATAHVRLAAALARLRIAHIRMRADWRAIAWQAAKLIIKAESIEGRLALVAFGARHVTLASIAQAGVFVAAKVAHCSF
jgi:hypothetical protein